MLTTSIIPAVIARLHAAGLFGGRIHAASNLAALMQSGQATQPVLRAHVLPADLAGREVPSASGAFIQNVDRGVAVLISLPVYDGTGATAATDIEQLIASTVAAIAGWSPGDTPGVFRMRQGRLLSLAGGTILYQLDFIIPDQLRISP